MPDASPSLLAQAQPPTPRTLDEALHLLAVERARAQAAGLDAVARFASVAIHDYNNLLSVINGYCEMLAPELETQPEIAAQIAEIHKAGQKAIALSRLLMSFSGKQPFSPQVLDLNALLQQHHAYLADLVATSRATLRVECATAAPCCVQTDAEQFKQVLHHLVANARDALAGQPSSEVVIKIELQEPSHNGAAQQVSLSVTDNGPGIDAALRPQLFQPFVTTKRTGKGIGLGLWFVRSVVERSGGTISARPAEPRGAAFEILLPIAAAR